MSFWPINVFIKENAESCVKFWVNMFISVNGMDTSQQRLAEYKLRLMVVIHYV